MSSFNYSYSQAPENTIFEYDHLVKIMIIGNSGVGKSTLLKRFVDRQFLDNYISTSGIDFKVKNMTFNDENVRINIWDSSAQTRYKHITSSYFKGTQGFLIVFDVTDRSSFDGVREWIELIDKFCSNSTPSRILVGTKSDLVQRTVSIEEARQFAERYHMNYVDTSSKFISNSIVQTPVDKIFVQIVQEILKEKLIPFNTNHSVLFNPDRRPWYRRLSSCCS